MTNVPNPAPETPQPDLPGQTPRELPPGGLPGGPQGRDVVPGVGRIDLNVGEDAGDLGDQGDIAADDAGATAAAQRVAGGDQPI